jgi:signal transduction histidine kinase
MVPFAATLALAAEWLRVAEAPWAWAAAAAAVATIALLWRPDGPARQLVAALLGLVALVLLLAQRRLDRIEHHWDAEREAIVAAAGERLRGDLHAAFELAEGLAMDAAPLAAGERAAAFASLDRLRRRGGLDAGVAILERDGTPWAWAGAHRLAPASAGDSIAAAWSQYYVTLESRRHSARGRVTVASVLVWAHPAVPARAGSLAARFRERTQVALDIVRPEAAPDSPDVFDYCEPDAAGDRCLFSAVPRPPDQADARAQALQRGGQAVAALLLLAMLAGLVAAATPRARWLLVPLLLWMPLRAPVGPLVGLESLFSPATYFFRNATPLSGSAGLLALSGALLLLAAIELWERRLPRRWWRVALGVALVLATPYAVGDLSRGIAPPAAGTPLGLWVTWQVALFCAGAGLVVLAAALLRGDGPPRRSGWVWVAVALVVLAAVAGVMIWRPGRGWPIWYPGLWLPALVVALAPLRARQAVLGVALAAGSLAALLTWSAELRGQMAEAQREVFRLGEMEDPVALGLVDLFGDEASAAPAPQGAAELYALWRGSLLAAQGYPARLAVWERERGWYAELPLDSLEVAQSVLDSLVQAERRPAIVRVPASPGLHYVLRAPVGERATLVAVVGPATQLVPPGRLGRLLEPSEPREPPFRLALAPPLDGAGPPGPFRWRREGWSVQAGRALAFGGQVREATVQLPLRTPERLLLRGAVLLVLDAALLALLWLGARFLSRRPLPRLPLGALLASFRGSLALTLALFFILPAVLLSAWGFVQLAGESRRAADVLVSHRMADALHAAGGLQAADEASRAGELAALSERVDAHLGFYGGGRLLASSSPVLPELGMLPPLMDDVAFRSLALQGRLEAVRDGPALELAERIGYRLVRPGAPPEVGVLALPQRHGEVTSAPRQDLALVLLLTLLGGIGAALLAAQGASRRLARPVATLQEAALALGAGRSASAALAAGRPPEEFTPVFGAFRRMEDDLRAGRLALEEARRRTERVLATVATGVVALDGDGAVVLANRQAEVALGTALPPGTPFVARLGGEWGALAEALGARGAATGAERALEVSQGDRRHAVQLAPLGPDGGVVLALTDVTDLSRAERVLAWGEMARQVAHEIKNPLTPMRLGIQHLQRTWRDRRADYGGTLEETTSRILAEIDRLDQVARAFSRFGVPATAPLPIEPVDLAAVAREVRQLYALSGEGVDVTVAGPARALVRARKDEVKEVLVNLLENARNAAARAIVVEVRPDGVTVRDDGSGIEPAVLPRVFEPHFSTTTSGSGLGLSIVQRLVEGWGGRVAIASEPGRGTTVTVSGVPAEPG